MTNPRNVLARTTASCITARPEQSARVSAFFASTATGMHERGLPTTRALGVLPAGHRLICVLRHLTFSENFLVRTGGLRH